MLMKVQKQIRPLREDPFTFVVRLLNEGYEVEYMPEVDDMLPLIRGGKDVVTSAPRKPSWSRDTLCW